MIKHIAYEINVFSFREHVGLLPYQTLSLCLQKTSCTQSHDLCAMRPCLFAKPFRTFCRARGCAVLVQRAFLAVLVSC